MRFAYADPPYPGQSAKHYAEQPDYDGEVDHHPLICQLTEYDGWALSTASTTLQYVLDLCSAHDLRQDRGDFRILAWVKPFAAFKRNVSVAYAWEPILVKPLRRAEPNRLTHTMRDWLAEPITLQKGLVGAKPQRFCEWLFEVAGLDPADSFDDLFPGSGAVTAAWEGWRSQLKLARVGGRAA